MSDKSKFRLTDKQINVEMLERIIEIHAGLQALASFTISEIGKIEDKLLTDSKDSDTDPKPSTFLQSRFDEEYSKALREISRDIYPDILE